MSEAGRRDRGILALFVLPVRGLVVMVLATAFIWACVGGETVTCEGTRENWRCVRRPDAPFLRLVGLGDDEMTGPDGVTDVDVRRRRGWAATVHHASGDWFRLARQPTADRAEADREAVVSWAGHATGSLVRSGPPRAPYRGVAWAATLLTVATVLATASTSRRP